MCAKMQEHKRNLHSKEARGAGAAAASDFVAAMRMLTNSAARSYRWEGCEKGL